jgi:hypothetical protein
MNVKITKWIISVFTVLIIIATCNNIYAWKPTTPILTCSTTGTIVNLSWSDVNYATGYILSYAPYPAGSPINSFLLPNSNSAIFDLWDGAAFYVAIQAYNDTYSDKDISDYSNIEKFIITGGGSVIITDSAWNNLKGVWSYCENTPGSTISLKMLRIYSINYGYNKDAFPYKEEVQYAAGYGNTTCSGSPAQTWSDYTLSDEVFDIKTFGSTTQFQLIYNYSSTDIIIQNGGNEMLYGKGSLMDPVIFHTR